MSESVNEERVEAVLGLVIREHEVLLMHRSQDPNRGLWTPPGGKCLSGESPFEALDRELFEETGRRVVARSFVGILLETVAGAPGWRHHLFVCDLEDGSIREQCSEGMFQWVAVDQVLENVLPIPQADRIFWPWIFDRSVPLFQAHFEYDRD